LAGSISGTKEDKGNILDKSKEQHLFIMDITVIIEFYRYRRISPAARCFFHLLTGQWIKLNTGILRGTPFDNF